VLAIIMVVCESGNPKTAIAATHNYSAQIKLNIKSYISVIDPFHVGFQDASAYVQYKASLLAAFTNQSALDDPKDSREWNRDYRIFSEKEFKIKCEGKKMVEFESSKAHFKIGREVLPYLNLSVTPQHGEFVYDDVEMRNGDIYFQFKVRAKPPAAAEALFSEVKVRTSVYAWHSLEGVLSCAPETSQGYKIDYALGGSSFPSRRLWINGNLKKEVVQGNFDSLWTANPFSAAEIL
jgi:hypothetical protein